MSPEKEKQKKQFKKKKRKRRKIKNMKGMIASFIIAFLLISAFYVVLLMRIPIVSDNNTIPVSGRIVSVISDSRTTGTKGSLETWVMIEFDNGEQYDIQLQFLKDVGFASTEDFRNRIIYKKATIRYHENDIPSIYSLNYDFVYLKIGSDVIIDYNFINGRRTRDAILVGICFLVLLGIVDVFIWLSYGKHRVG